MLVTCDRCGVVADDEQPPLTWSLSMEDGKVRRYCERCTRENVRAIEGKLDEEDW